jgi:anti-sigma regulatory factor (Ser/Thr protein kinase)
VGIWLSSEALEVLVTISGDRRTPPKIGTSFTHPALFYRDTDDFLLGVGAFVSEAEAMNEPVFVAVPKDRLDALHDNLSQTAADITTADMTELGRNPGRVIAALRDFADRHAGAPVRMVVEPLWPGRTPGEIREAIRHEALLNTAFQGRPATVLCPYDIARLPEEVITAARRTHPSYLEAGLQMPGTAFADPAEVCAECDTPLPEPPSSAAVLRFQAGDLALVRDTTESWLRQVRSLKPGDAPARREGDFLLAVNEAAANTIAHSGGAGTLRLWTDGAFVTAEIQDGGRLTDPLAGRSRPTPESTSGGRGLWIIHHVCDLVETRSVESGFTLRLHMALPL